MPRRRGSAPPPEPFAQAIAGIDTLEQAVIQRVLDVRFCPEQVVRWMFPDELVNTLQAAYPYVMERYQGNYIQEKLLLPITAMPVVPCLFCIQANNVKMLVPEQGNSRPGPAERGEPILAALRQVYEQHQQFEKVRKVVRWLNAHATAGAARHYCPWLTSVLPPDHPFHKTNGDIFREPGGTAGIIGTMRECAAIMAGALLCGPRKVPSETLITVQFVGERDMSFPGTVSRETYTSHAFDLL